MTTKINPRKKRKKAERTLIYIPLVYGKKQIRPVVLQGLEQIIQIEWIIDDDNSKDGYNIINNLINQQFRREYSRKPKKMIKKHFTLMKLYRQKPRPIYATQFGTPELSNNIIPSKTTFVLKFEDVRLQNQHKGLKFVFPCIGSCCDAFDLLNLMCDKVFWGGKPLDIDWIIEVEEPESKKKKQKKKKKSKIKSDWGSEEFQEIADDQRQMFRSFVMGELHKREQPKDDQQDYLQRYAEAYIDQEETVKQQKEAKRRYDNKMRARKGLPPLPEEDEDEDNKEENTQENSEENENANGNEDEDNKEENTQENSEENENANGN
eukprot:365868_1